MATASSKIDEAVTVLLAAQRELKTRMDQEPSYTSLFLFLRDQEERIYQALAALGE